MDYCFQNTELWMVDKNRDCFVSKQHKISFIGTVGNESYGCFDSIFNVNQTAWIW